MQQTNASFLCSAAHNSSHNAAIRRYLSQHSDMGMQVDMAIQDGAGKTKVETQDFRLKPQKTLFGYDATEKVEGWVCRIFEADGRMTAMEHLKVINQAISQSVSQSVSQSINQPTNQSINQPLIPGLGPVQKNSHK